ncbi:hypothetical protein ACLOJK_015737 [Asimina triloba]
MNKVAGIGISIILVVGVVIGVVAGVSHAGFFDGGSEDSAFPATAVVSTKVKSAQAICEPMDYKGACEETLKKSNGEVDLKELVKLFFNETMLHVQRALQKSEQISLKATDPMNKAAMSDCKDLLEYAKAELQLALTDVGDREVQTMPERVHELRNWLSAVISYQETCKDGITDPELKSAMSDGMVNATQVTSNALAIVTEISSLLEKFHVPFNLSSLTPRNLLEQDENSGEVHDLDLSGTPHWLSGSDRKLLAFKDTDRPKPNVVVAKDGSGNFNSIGAALKAMPKSYSGRYIIYVKAGLYSESVIVDKDQTNVFMYGDGPRRTIVTGSKNYVDGTPTFQTATFAAVGNNFLCKSMGFRNTAGPEKHQAVALRTQSDMSAFVNCRMDGYQDTLLVQAKRQFYRNCVISGTVDFIFGDAAAVLQNCLLVVRKPMDNQQCLVTAQGRTDKRENTGIVIHNCRIAPEAKLFPQRLTIRSYLGRPWKEYSRTVIMESTIGDLIQPDGWMPWDGDFALNTLYYAEYANRGPGSGTAKRIKWKGYKVITDRKEALPFTAGNFIQGGQWLKSINAPYMLGFRR